MSAIASTELQYAPLGIEPRPLSALFKEGDVARDFRDKDAVLWLARAQRLPDKDCAQVAQALVDQVSAPVIAGPVAKSAEIGFKSWEPWSKKDLEAVSGCDSFPCDVKLNKAETEALAKLPEAKRFDRFTELVQGRSQRYLASGERKEYEFPGDPVDPWAIFAQAGLKNAAVAQPAEPRLHARRVEFGPADDVRVLHQVVDRRAARSADGREAVSWLRDVYTDHYFDSWGEWTGSFCENAATGKGVLLVQALALELDLLKKTDLISRIARGKMRDTVEKNGRIYLDRAFDRLK